MKKIDLNITTLKLRGTSLQMASELSQSNRRHSEYSDAIRIHSDRSRGFTLIETVVIITIIGIITTAVATAVPIARSNQNVVSDIETIRAEVQDATRRALNENRPQECLDVAGEERRCSNVGVHLKGSTMTLFADLDQNHQFSSTDFTYEVKTLRSSVVSEEVFVFEATPPNIILFSFGRIVTADNPGSFTLVSGNQSRTMTVLPYGQIQDEQQHNSP